MDFDKYIIDFNRKNSVYAVNEGELVFAAVSLDHSHIYSMCSGLIKAGAVCKYVYDEDCKKVAEFLKLFPSVTAAKSLDQILEDNEVKLVAAAAIPYLRCDLGIKVMNAGKDYFTDKAPLTNLEQLEKIKLAVKSTSQKYFVYYSERLHVESAILAGILVDNDVIGKVCEVTCLAPHKLSADTRPDWFFNRKKSGGILCDIGSHQIEQFLYYTKNKNATVKYAYRSNFANKQYPDFDDYGCAEIVGENGAIQHLRVDWLSPEKLNVFGDGRLFLLGTKGYIEVRKYIDVAKQKQSNNVYVVNDCGEQYINATGTVGFPFFKQLIYDCINRTEAAMTSEHIFAAAKLAIEAQSFTK